MGNLLSQKNRPKHDYGSSRYGGATSRGGGYSSIYGAHSAVSSDSGSYPFINNYPTVTSTSTVPPVSATPVSASVERPSTTSWASSYHPNGVTRKPYETDGVIKSASRETYGISAVKPTSTGYFATVESNFGIESCRLIRTQSIINQSVWEVIAFPLILDPAVPLCLSS